MTNAALSISPPPPGSSTILPLGEGNRSELEELKTLKSDLLAALPSTDKDVFCRVFDRTQRQLRLDDNELAKILQVSRPTVGRWARGVTAPHPIGRRPVLEYLAKRVESSIRMLKR